jgi:TonB-linked SusC/RagA family outer membrane protein
MNQRRLLFFWQKKQCFYILILLFISSTLFAQQPSKVSGTVISKDDGLSLPGVGVKIKNSSTGTVTDIDGKYSLNVAKGETLVFSFISFTPKEVVVGDNKIINVSLETSLKALNEVVVNGYFSQKKSEVTGAVAIISGEDILKSPVTNVTNSLIGRVPGVIAQQSSGRPGNNQANLYIRGRVSPNSEALIIVDGVERQTFGDIDPNEIESLTVLKDAASTALYGLKGANGVFVITTKSGKEGKSRVNFTSNVGIVSPTQLPGFLPAFESATLHTEGQINIGQQGSRLFSDNDLQIFKDGTGDPLLYPNVNWYKALTRPNWLQTQQNITISGGSKVATYFTSFGYMYEDGMFKDFKTQSGYKTTPSYNRYNFRSNVNLNLTKTTKIGIKIAGRLENRYSLQGNSNSADIRTVFNNGLEGLVSRILAVPAWGLPFFPEYTNSDDPAIQKLDATYNHIENYQVLGVNTYNPYAMMTRQGYVSYDNNAIESILTFDQGLDKIIKGLSARALFGYDAYLGSGKRQNGGFASYDLNRATKELTLSRNSVEDALGGIVAGRYGYIKTSLQAALNYKRSFGQNNVGANFIATRDLKGAEGAAPPITNQGLVYNLTYNYGDKYFVQASGALSGSEAYPQNKRYGFFPAFSAGYTISNEKFLKDVNWIDLIKIRASAGLVGLVNAGTQRFLYLDAYSSGTGVAFGTPGSSTSVPTVRHSSIGNPDITWEKSFKRNIGFESAFLKNTLEFTFDLFDDRRFDVVLPRNNTGYATYGETLPQVNYGEYFNRGYEASLSYRNKIGKFNYSLSPNITFAKNKATVVDESPKLPDFQKKINQSIGQIYGYKVVGFYKDAADIAASPVNKLISSGSIPGDLKYEDLNNDGLITTQDQTAIGYSNIPQYVLGFNMNFSYRNFSVSALLQGVSKVSSDLVFTSGNRNQYFEPMLDRWTPTHQDATWPAIRPGGVPNNPNDPTNDFLLQDASYIKLRNIEFRYTFGQKVIRQLRVSGLSIFASGQNLKTWTKFYGLDPENYTNTSAFATKTTTYPTSKIVNFGLNVQF